MNAVVLPVLCMYTSIGESGGCGGLVPFISREGAKEGQ